MIDIKKRTGRDLKDMSIYEIIMEYKKSDEEISRTVVETISLGIDKDAHGSLNRLCCEFKEYKRDLSEELMKRMI